MSDNLGEYRYEKLTWPEIEAAVKAGKVPIVPIGAVEQHGPHLPLDVDMLLSTSVALVAGYVFLAVASCAGALELSLERCVLFGACLSIGLLSLLLNESAASGPSLLLLGAMYLPFVFVLKPGSLSPEDDARWVMDRFLDVGAFCAACGVAQFLAQSVVHADWLFDFTRYIPEKLRASGTFNTVIPMGSFNKSNGFFFREPSGFSYLMALAVIGEAFTHRRKARLALLGLALLLTYSGTGLLALLLGTLHPLGPKTLLRLGVIAVVGGLVFWLLGDTLNLSFTLGRVNEFNSTYSSGYMRYVAPARLVSESIDSSLWAPWLAMARARSFAPSATTNFTTPLGPSCCSSMAALASWRSSRSFSSCSVGPMCRCRCGRPCSGAGSSWVGTCSRPSRTSWRWR